jgi:hydroxymethylpyrimidine pyrophosphatase-like HAD family hydrolase
VATGRNLKKTQEVIDSHIPFDYIVFSSGAGVYDCRSKKLLSYSNMNESTVKHLSKLLIERDLNFHLFKPVPENHKCWFHRGSTTCSEFEKYFDFHQSDAEPFPEIQDVCFEACQFLVVFPNDVDRFTKLWNEIQSRFPDVKVVRTTSPLDTGYIWMEIFHHSVSKGNGVRFVCDIMQISHEHTLGIGNDYNDIDLLEFTNYSYIVANGPTDLKGRFISTKSNEESAFAEVVKFYL